MNVLIIGGTGNISTGIVKALRERFSGEGETTTITVFNRGQTTDSLPPEVKRLHGDRNDFAAFEKQFADKTWDVVIDMICFRSEQAESGLRAFAGRTGHFLFCSTVCTYGNTQTVVPTTESMPLAAQSPYGKNKAACEAIFFKAFRGGAFGAGNGFTVLRPSHTIGAGNKLHGNLGGSPTFIDRLRRGLPVIVSGDGHGLWQLASADDVGRGFAYAVGRPQTFGEAYNVVADQIRTWDEVTCTIAAALGAPAPKIVHIPTDLLLAIDAKRYGGLREIFQYHGVYSNAKIRRDIPEFQNRTPIAETIRKAVAWMDAHGYIKSAETDSHEDKLIDMFRAFSESAVKMLAPAK
ncbi:MAG: NAD-dependent epimerase/dehydratase family protein [Phycisphaerales bacterium]|nr:NAD-dependent epimerase/dehydratase family protein [Phycisphaerales bacterium]